MFSDSLIKRRIGLALCCVFAAVGLLFSKLIDVQVVGLMTMAPFTKDEKKTRSCFSLLRNMKNNLNKSLPLNSLKELSMGMSNDYEIAIEEGATQVRLGTVLFGPRN